MALLVFSGCSIYLPADVDSPPPPGSNVRIRLTTEGAVRVSDEFGRPTREVEGKLLGLMGDSVGLGLLATTEYGRPWELADTLWLGLGEVIHLDEKKIDRRRTTFLVGGVSLVTGVVVASLFRASGGSEEGDPPGEIDGLMMPILSIRH